MMQMDVIAEKVQRLIDEPYCCDALASAGESWLASLDTDQYVEKTENLIMELGESILPIDDLIHYCEIVRPDWFQSKEEADKLLVEARGIKENGGKYCNCGACTLSLELLSILGEKT